MSQRKTQSAPLTVAVQIALGLALAVPAATPVFAQSQIEEVVITAQKREENLQDTPIAITAYSAETLEKMGVKSFDNVISNTPSLVATPYPSSNNTLTVFMRGQGVGDAGQITKDGAVGLYVDGFYVSRLAAVTFDVADVERVEVLRGPQGTLYGRNTTGGAVNIISKKPTGEFGIKQSLTFGNYGNIRSLTSVDLPSWNGFAAKLSFVKSKHDGYIENRDSGSNDFDKEDNTAGRLALRWSGDNGITLDYSLEKGKIDSTPQYYHNNSLVGLPPFDNPNGYPFPDYPAYSIDRDKSYRPIDLPESSAKYTQNSFTATWEINDNLTIKSLTGHRKLGTKYYQDYAEVFFAGFRTEDEINAKQWSEELQVIGSAFNNRIKYVGGLYYFKETADHFENVKIGLHLTPGLFGSYQDKDRFVDADSKSRAIFGQVTWTPPILDDKLDLTIGGRYTKDDRSATRTKLDAFYFYLGAFGFDGYQPPSVEDGTLTPEGPISNSLSFSKFNPAFTANYKITDDVSTYFRYATGYRAGGSSESGVFYTETFDPETVKTYEIGVKSTWLDQRLRANLAVFQNDFTDIQLDLSPDATDLSLTQTVNAGKAKVKGIELDVTLVPIDGLTINASWAHLDDEIESIVTTNAIRVPDTSTPDPADYLPNGTEVKDYFSLAYIPGDNYSVSADYTFPFAGGTLSPRVDFNYTDRFLGSTTSGKLVPNGDYYYIPPKGLADARVTYARELAKGGKIRAGLWCKNLADREYLKHVIGNGDITGYFGKAGSFGTPRTYGVDFVYEY